ncbi:MAG: class IV adenylate cyclase [Sulfolobales archaeon]
MGKEYEVKVRVNDLSRVRANIVRLGGSLLAAYSEEDYYVDLRNCVSVAYKDLVFRVRIREVNGVVEGELTLKGPKKTLQTFRVRDELNIKIEKPYELVNFLRNLTFKTLKVSKVREIYSLKGFKIFLDRVSCLGSFIEVELDEVEDLAVAEEKLNKLLKELEAGQEVVSKSYAEMLMEVMDCEE